jgi:hypothetical protein
MEMRGKRAASSYRPREAAFGPRIDGPWKGLLREERGRATSKVPPGPIPSPGGRSSRRSCPERDVTLGPKRSKGLEALGSPGPETGPVREEWLRPDVPFRSGCRPRGKPRTPEMPGPTREFAPLAQDPRRRSLSDDLPDRLRGPCAGNFQKGS